MGYFLGGGRGGILIEGGERGLRRGWRLLCRECREGDFGTLERIEDLGGGERRTFE